MAKESGTTLSTDDLATVSGGGALVERTDGDLSVQLGFGEVTGTTASGGLFQGTWSPAGNSLFTNNQVQLNILTGEGELGMSVDKGGYIAGEGSLLGVEAQTTLGGWLPVGASLELGTASAQASMGEGLESKVTALEADVTVGSISGDPDAGVAPNALAVGLGLNLAQASMENGQPTSRLDGDAQLTDVDGDGWADLQASVTVPLGNLASVDISVGLNTGTTIDNTIAAGQWVGDQAVGAYDAAVAGAAALGDSIASGWDAMTAADPADTGAPSAMDGLNPMGDFTGFDTSGVDATSSDVSATQDVSGLQDDMQADQQLSSGLGGLGELDEAAASVPQDSGWSELADSDFG
ncbi:MAG: hypothetical protein KA190_00230, partial [Kofleriaceae bacterium]|nr:hypothetical protein [Kofleriaceae bacterium]